MAHDYSLYLELARQPRDAGAVAHNLPVIACMAGPPIHKGTQLLHQVMDHGL